MMSAKPQISIRSNAQSHILSGIHGWYFTVEAWWALETSIQDVLFQHGKLWRQYLSWPWSPSMPNISWLLQVIKDVTQWSLPYVDTRLKTSSFVKVCDAQVRHQCPAETNGVSKWFHSICGSKVHWKWPWHKGETVILGEPNFATSMTKSEGYFVGISLEASLARSSSYETWQLEADQKNSNIFK